MDGGGKSAALGPPGHGARLLDLDQRGVGEDRRALGRRRDDVDVLQNKTEVFRACKGEQAERSEIGLAEMAEPDEP